MQAILAVDPDAAPPAEDPTAALSTQEPAHQLLRLRSSGNSTAANPDDDTVLQVAAPCLPASNSLSASIVLHTVLSLTLAITGSLALTPLVLCFSCTLAHWL